MPARKSKSIQEQTATAAPAQPQVQPVSLQAPDFKSIYTNFVQAAFSPLDVFLMLGEAMGPAPDGKPVILQHAKVIMTPVEAKIVIQILQTTMAQYEKQFGKVPVAKSLLP